MDEHSSESTMDVLLAQAEEVAQEELLLILNSGIQYVKKSFHADRKLRDDLGKVFDIRENDPDTHPTVDLNIDDLFGSKDVVLVKHDRHLDDDMQIFRVLVKTEAGVASFLVDKEHLEPLRSDDQNNVSLVSEGIKNKDFKPFVDAGGEIQTLTYDHKNKRIPLILFEMWASGNTDLGLMDHIGSATTKIEVIIGGTPESKPKKGKIFDLLAIFGKKGNPQPV